MVCSSVTFQQAIKNPRRRSRGGFGIKSLYPREGDDDLHCSRCRARPFGTAVATLPRPAPAFGRLVTWGLVVHSISSYPNKKAPTASLTGLVYLGA